ncbi:hypothetical protein JL100_021375 [Skermanella mucosa]|uniref:hypothetical protein n=1 Tax=Skermanella mucosa TaxID=1789672 RepID=UPI00192A8079|nr:hypothetical protein [Skermanella mucosa]UEM19621.1 hypothetical protein JL100_021375 [Skermanella mucosa]
MKAAIIVLATALSIGGANAQTAGPAAGSTAGPTSDPHDYPTSARVDYVIGCMATNGQTQEVMERCSCSIDHISRTIPYNSFVQLETVRRMQDQPGERAMLFRGVGWVKDLQERFRLAQVEADLECFPQ